jgi:glycosyltransferase involved in cell wall biosynthesis
VKPRVLFISRRITTPLQDGERRRWDAVRQVLDFRVIASGVGGDDEFRLAREPPVLAGLSYYAALPARIAAELRRFRPHAVVAQGLHETAATLTARTIARSDTAVIADVHGDWRAPTRLYGSRLRTALNPAADRIAELALRRADGVRTVTAYTTALVRERGVEPTDEFPAFMDFALFLARPPAPLPEHPEALFVGVLERYKNVDGLATAWRRAAPRVEGARLHLVGNGALASTVRRLVHELPDQTRWSPSLRQAQVADALDGSTCLVLPSRSEGMGRVVIEAFCRGRGVVGTRVGGIPDLVEDGANGLLVEPGDVEALAHALERVLGDRYLAERLGRAAHASADLWTISAEEFARRLRALVDRVARLE